MVMLPLAAPAAVGVKVTSSVQDADGARLEPQSPAWLNGPLAEIEPICNGPLPVLASTIGRARLDVPTACCGNRSALGCTVAAGVVPLPVRDNDWLAPRLDDVSLNFSVPVALPVWAGV